MAQYNIGLADFVNGSNVITGSGTEWLTNLEPGNLIIRQGEGISYTIANVSSDTELEISVNYAGLSSGGFVGYVGHKDFNNLGIPLMQDGDLETVAIYNEAIKRLTNASSGNTFYLGPHATDPTTDNSGGPLVAGMQYFNTTDDELKVYDGAAWLSPVADAEAFAIAAGISAGNAATSESNAATSETNAANSAGAAATSEGNAATSETNAATSEGNAATSETNASNSASAASVSETNAANSAIAADDTLKDFETKYLGAKAADPTLDNEGNALIVGALYFNSTSNELRVYDGANWIAIPTITFASQAQAEAGTDNTTAMTPLRVFQAIPSYNSGNAATVRSDIGLGTMATQNEGTGGSNFRDNTANDARFAQSSTLGTMATQNEGTSGANFRDNTANDARFLLEANNLSDVTNPATAFTNIKQAATESATGVLERATQAEAEAGADNARAMTPLRVSQAIAAQGGGGGGKKGFSCIVTHTSASSASVGSFRANAASPNITFSAIFAPNDLGTTGLYNLQISDPDGDLNGGDVVFKIGQWLNPNLTSASFNTTWSTLFDSSGFPNSDGIRWLLCDDGNNTNGSGQIFQIIMEWN